MKKKYTKDLLLLVAIILFCSITARYLAGHETLDEYAQKHSSAQSASSQVSSDAASGISSSTAANSAASGSAASSDAGSAASSFSSKDISAASDSSTDAVKTDVGNASVSTPDSDVSDTRVMYSDGFYYEDLPESIVSKITGVSYPENCEVSLDDLRYCVMLYVDMDGETKAGEMICNKAIADDVMEIFHELYENDYQLGSIKLVEDFGGDDNASMEANNTSCFNYRQIKGVNKLSKHSLGLAIDLNPLYNPCIRYKKGGTMSVSPEVSEEYADRTASFPYKIDENDLAYKLFTSHGFTWGGNWNSSKDYQHFEKKIK
ncbi:MAG: M15 family metallopeptidase [Butyrivibrio sp.]|nr:M15 family metallopeptidase [Butyrivibrio sp.]